MVVGYLVVSSIYLFIELVEPLYQGKSDNCKYKVPHLLDLVKKCFAKSKPAEICSKIAGNGFR